MVDFEARGEEVTNSYAGRRVGVSEDDYLSTTKMETKKEVSFEERREGLKEGRT